MFFAAVIACVTSFSGVGDRKLDQKHKNKSGEGRETDEGAVVAIED